MPFDHLHRLGAGVEKAVDALRHRLKERSGGYGPLEILPFRGHGNRHELRISGRVLEDRQLPVSRDEDSLLDNLLAAYRRFETDEVPHAPVVVRARDTEVRALTGPEGYFHVRVPGAPPDGRPAWETVDVEVPGDEGRGLFPARAAGTARVPGPDADFGVISDVDDTVLRTDATSLLAAARHTLFHNARSRLPFPGVAAFYRALVGGPEGGGNNPVFYVSSSPWNLYDLLVEFLDLQGIPDGPLFL